MGGGHTVPADVIDTLRGTGAYTASVLCFAAMRYRAWKISEPPLWVAQETEDGEEWLKDHELSEVLTYPNDDEEMADILEQLSMSLDDTGLGLLVKDADRIGRPGRMTFFRGDEFTVHPTQDRIYGRFDVTTRRGMLGDRPESFAPEDVVFFRLPHPQDRWQGFGPVQVVARQLGIERQILTSLIAGIRNAVVPGLTVTFHDDATTEQVRDAMEQIRAGYGSALNHGKPFGVGNVRDAKQNKIGFDGLAGGELYREIESAVCVAFQVRPEVLGMMVGLENSPWSHMDTAQRLAYDEAIIPMWRRLERTFTRQLLRPVDDTPERKILFDTDKVRALQEDDERNAKIAVLLRDIATRNQRRQVAGLEPQEGAYWDEVQERNPQPLPNPEAPDPTVRTEAGRAFDYERKDIPGAAILWAEFDISTKNAARLWEPEVARLLAKQSTDIQRLFRRYVREAGGVPTQETLLKFLQEVGDYLTAAGAAEARRTLEPLVRASSTTAARRLTARLGFGFDVVQAGIERYITEETNFLVSVMGETTGRAVARTVQDSIEERIPLRDLRSRLEGLPEFDRPRAQLTARTETTRATNGAQRRAAQEYEVETGTRMEKAWLSSRDDRVRDEHEELDDKQWYPVGWTFANGRLEPGEPNCRCTLAYRIAEEA